MRSNACKDTTPHAVRKPLSSFSGMQMGVDISIYMYRSMQLCDGWYDPNTGEMTGRYDACCEWIATKMELLVRCNVQPVIVWDGRPLKSKGDHAGASREEKREVASANLAAFIDTGGDLASDEGVKRIKALACRSAKFHDQSFAFFTEKGYVCLTAPKEADAQLCGLELRRITQCTLTGDGDLLVFGCGQVIFDTPGKTLSGKECYSVVSQGHALCMWLCGA